MSEQLDKILSLIPSLSITEHENVRTALKASAAFLSQQGPSIEAEQKLETDWLFTGLVDYMVGRGVVAKRHAELSLSRRRSFKTYQAKRADLSEYLAALEQQAKTYTRHRVLLGHLCASSMAILLEQRAIFSVSAMLTQIDKLPEAIDAQFPGYLSAGLFQYVLDIAEKNLAGH